MVIVKITENQHTVLYVLHQSPKLQVFLMDGTFRMLTLAHGADTTVDQLHAQMMRELRLPPQYTHIFTLWICSRNLRKAFLSFYNCEAGVHFTKQFRKIFPSLP